MFTGDDSTSIGTFYTNIDQNNSKLNEPLTVTTSDITQTHTSSLTQVNTETEIRLNNFSEELQSIKQLLHSMIEQKTKPNEEITNTNTNEAMQVEYDKNLATKRKAGDSEESICDNQ